MSYVVLARECRPETFEEVVGQQPIVRTLQNAIRSNRVAQAFLFTGPRGVGKTSVARILAKALNCEQGPTPTPCNRCDACEEIRKTISPDVFEIDGASNTGVDNVRDLQETIRYHPQKHRYKIYIVDEVHMLSTPAFNAFLKTLEEPPPHVVFIFATTEPHKIIETVVDRCQRYDFKKIPSPLIFEHLQRIVNDKNLRVGSPALHLIAREADGSLRDAQSLLDQIVTYAGTGVGEEDVADILGVVPRATLLQISSAVANGEVGECLEIMGNIFQYGMDIRQLYRGLVEHFRNLLVAKLTPRPELFPNLQEEEIAELVQQVQNIGLEKLQSLLTVLIESERYLYQAPLPRIVLEAVMVRLATAPSAASLKEILAKLISLQERLAPPIPGAVVSPSPPPSLENARIPEPTEQAAETPAPSLYEENRAVADTRVEEDSALDHLWQECVQYIRTKKPLLGSLLDHTKLIKKENGVVDIAFEGNSLFLESLQEPQKKADVTRFCGEFFGETVRVIVQDHTKHAVNPGGNQTEPTKEQKIAQLKKEAREHPLVKEALSLFGGGIAEIKVLDSEKT
ncbi:MAG: DNA polymerase III subunit gamma/tau [Deltaproteobacteria bacterium]|nr:DNA polymerase III subunit gamma/tau [Deltaproteobacteria bacterium]